MPRNNKKCSPTAINAVHNGLFKKSAALKFKLSRSTLQHRLKNPDCKVIYGRATVLSEEEEETT